MFVSIYPSTGTHVASSNTIVHADDSNSSIAPQDRTEPPLPLFHPFACLLCLALLSPVLFTWRASRKEIKRPLCLSIVCLSPRDDQRCMSHTLTLTLSTSPSPPPTPPSRQHSQHTTIAHHCSTKHQSRSQSLCHPLHTYTRPQPHPSSPSSSSSSSSVARLVRGAGADRS
jgi:hypothetical protein